MKRHFLIMNSDYTKSEVNVYPPLDSSGIEYDLL